MLKVWWEMLNGFSEQFIQDF